MPLFFGACTFFRSCGASKGGDGEEGGASF